MSYNREDLEQRIEAYRDDMTEALARLVRIRSVEGPAEPGHPYGTGPAECLKEALALGRGLGFDVHDMDGHCGWIEYGAGEEMVAVLGHLDVVPEGDGWTHDPYDPVVMDGKMYGRGTIDDKGPVTAALFALKAVRDAGIPLRRRVRLLLGCNEETGAADMKYYLAHGGEIPVSGFTPDGEYPLINGEKGIINETYSRRLNQEGPCRVLSLRGGVAGNVVPDHAEALLSVPGDLELSEADGITVLEQMPEDGVCAGTFENIRTVLVEAAGKSAHGSTPEKGENAIGRLMLYMDRLPFRGDGREAVHFLASKFGIDPFGENLGCALEDKISGRFTCNLGVLQGNEEEWKVRLNYRYPVTFTEKDCQPAIQKAFTENGWEMTGSLHKPRLYIPEEAPLVQKLLRVYRDATGDMSAPKSIGGGTYAKAIPNIVAFGPIFPGDPVVEHLPDEFADLNSLIRNAGIYANAIVALAAE